MSKGNIVLRKADTIEWNRAVKIHELVTQLGDGCEVKDIAILMDAEKDIPSISSAVSKLVLAYPPVLSSVREGYKHTQIKVLRPLPDIVFDNPDREHRSYKKGTARIEEAIVKLNRKQLLLLKVEINKRLEIVKE